MVGDQFFHPCGGSEWPKCGSVEEDAMGYHESCLEFDRRLTAGPISAGFLRATEFAFEPPVSVRKRRRAFVLAELASILAYTYPQSYAMRSRSTSLANMLLFTYGYCRPGHRELTRTLSARPGTSTPHSSRRMVSASSRACPTRRIPTRRSWSGQRRQPPSPRTYTSPRTTGDSATFSPRLRRHRPRKKLVSGGGGSRHRREGSGSTPT